MMQKAIEFYALSLFDCFNSNELYTYVKFFSLYKNCYTTLVFVACR